jgi:adenine deaminase
MFTLGVTLNSAVPRAGVRVSLGTDSALTGEGDLIDEIGVASSTGQCTAEEIYDMVTCSAARILRLEDGSGELREGGRADLIVIGDLGLPPAVAIQEMRPKLVMVGGQIALISADFISRVPREYTKNLQPAGLCGRGEYLVAMNVAELIRATTPYLGADFRLAGRRVWA